MCGRSPDDGRSAPSAADRVAAPEGQTPGAVSTAPHSWSGRGSLSPSRPCCSHSAERRVAFGPTGHRGGARLGFGHRCDRPNQPGLDRLRSDRPKHPSALPWRCDRGFFLEGSAICRRVVWLRRDTFPDLGLGLGPEFVAADMLDNAGLAQHLDLLVAADTGLFHLAGARGRRHGSPWRARRPAGDGGGTARTAPGIRPSGYSARSGSGTGPAWSAGWPMRCVGSSERPSPWRSPDDMRIQWPGGRARQRGVYATGERVTEWGGRSLPGRRRRS